MAGFAYLGFILGLPLLVGLRTRRRLTGPATAALFGALLLAGGAYLLA